MRVPLRRDAILFCLKFRGTTSHVHERVIALALHGSQLVFSSDKTCDQLFVPLVQ